MICEGRFFKHARRKDGSWGNVEFYSILKEKWEELKE
jgi:hypothetical protein